MKNEHMKILIKSIISIEIEKENNYMCIPITLNDEPHKSKKLYVLTDNTIWREWYCEEHLNYFLNYFVSYNLNKLEKKKGSK